MQNLKITLLRGFLGFSFLLCIFAIPAFAHHPFEGNPADFGFLTGFFSGLAHPLIGLDHLLFLLSIGLIGGFKAKRWVPTLLCFGLIGTFLSVYTPLLIPGIEIFVAISILLSALISLGNISPMAMIPLIIAHGYALGQPMVGAEPTPIIFYLIGLLFSELVLIVLGILSFRKLWQFKKFFSLALIASGLALSFVAAY